MDAWAVPLADPVPYDTALRWQEALHHARVAGRLPDTVLILQHAPTITLGRRGRDNFLLRPPEELESRGIAVRHASRGGDVTYHGPGQWVLYPILRLGSGGADAHGHLWNLEEIALRVCRAFGVEAARRAGMRAVALLTLLGPEGFVAYDNLIASAPDFTALDGLPALRFA